MHPGVDFFPLLVVTVLAVAVPILLHRVPRVSVPIVVGEIVAGIVAGPSGLDLITGANPYLDFLKLFGFAYLMFMCGLEIDFRLLQSAEQDEAASSRWPPGPLGMALISFLVTLAAAGACALLLRRWGVVDNVVLMALVLSTTSLGVVAPVLKEHGLSRSLLGQYILVAAVVADLATVTLVSVYVIFHTRGLTLDLFFAVGLLATAFLVYGVVKLAGRYLDLEELVDELSHATAQLDTRGALALSVIFIALAQGLGQEVILGAFLAGAIVSLLSADEGSLLRPKLHALGYGFFIPIFFIMVGVDFDLQALFAAPRGLLMVPALLAAAFAVKYAASLVYRTIFPWRQVLALGTLTSSRLSLIVAIAAIGVEIGAISITANAAIVVVAIVTVIVSPIGFMRILPHQEHEGRRILVLGSSPEVRIISRRLREHGEEVGVLTRNGHLYDELRQGGIDVWLVDRHGEPDDLRRAGVERARAAAIMVRDTDEGMRLASSLQADHDVPEVVAYAQSPQDAERFQDAGIAVVDPSSAAVTMLEAMVRHPYALTLLADVDVARGVTDVVMTNRRLEGRTLRHIPLPGDALVLAVGRGGETIIAGAHTSLRHGDILTVVGSTAAVQEAVEAFTG